MHRIGRNIDVTERQVAARVQHAAASRCAAAQAAVVGFVSSGDGQVPEDDVLIADLHDATTSAAGSDPHGRGIEGQRAHDGEFLGSRQTGCVLDDSAESLHAGLLDHDLIRRILVAVGGCDGCGQGRGCAGDRESRRRGAIFQALDIRPQPSCPSRVAPLRPPRPRPLERKQLIQKTFPDTPAGDGCERHKMPLVKVLRLLCG